MDRYDLYESCVQSPGDLVPLLVAVHGGRPAVLGEDFCGTAAISRRWVRAVDGGRAIAVDRDPAPLGRVPDDPAIEVVTGDVCDTDADRHRADVIYAGNFSIGEWHERAELLRYLRHARSRLASGGVFVCDLYGGETAFLTGRTDVQHRGSEGTTIRYTWEQREADARTGRVVNAMHFRVLRGDAVEQELLDAFVYRWRLWGLAELRDAMREAGFDATAVYPRVADAVDDDGHAYVKPLDALDDSYDVLVAARVS